MKKSAKTVNLISIFACAAVVFVILVSYSCKVCIVEEFASKILRIRNVILMSAAILMLFTAVVTNARLKRESEKKNLLIWAYLQIGVSAVVAIAIVVLCFVGGGLQIKEFILKETIGWILIAGTIVNAAGGVLTLFVNQNELH